VPLFVNRERLRLRENRGDEAAVFGRHLRELRLARGLTQAEIAERCGTMVPVISNLERGMTVPTLSTLIHLAGALQCTMGELVKVFDEPRPTSPRRRLRQ
jgi:transcriptional regulator with XRE-family HTH domain